MVRKGPATMESRCVTLVAPGSIPQPEALQNPPFRAFTEASLLRRDGLHHWPLVIALSPALTPFQNLGDELKVPVL